MKRLLFYIILIFFQTACFDIPEFSEVPDINFTGLSKTSMRQGNFNEDSVYIYFNFKDGDGDLCRDANSSEADIFITDLRTGVLQERNKLPIFPENQNQPVSGSVRLLLYTTCCIYPNNISGCEFPGLIPSDTVQYEIYMVDRAGHKSNLIRTDPIEIRCQ